MYSCLNTLCIVGNGRTKRWYWGHGTERSTGKTPFLKISTYKMTMLNITPVVA